MDEQACPRAMETDALWKGFVFGPFWSGPRFSWFLPRLYAVDLATAAALLVQQKAIVLVRSQFGVRGFYMPLTHKEQTTCF